MAQGLHLIIQITLKVINFYGKFIEFFNALNYFFDGGFCNEKNFGVKKMVFWNWGWILIGLL